MTGRIIEISTEGIYLCSFRGFMLIKKEDEEIGRVPLDDIDAVISNAHGLGYSNNLIVELSKRNAILVVCGSNFNPAAYLLPVEGHYRGSGRIDAQLSLTQALKKNIWKQIVKSKIRNQGAVLSCLDLQETPFFRLADKVKTGDPENIEAQAARRYFPLVFGRNFKRDRTEDTINAMLNYGYMVLRSTVARYIIASGFHPSIPLYHKNTLNSMRLVDDLMEPYRPYVDILVYKIQEDGYQSVNQETKPMLAEVLDMAVSMPYETTTLKRAIELTIQSFARVCSKEDKKIYLPLPDMQILKG